MKIGTHLISIPKATTFIHKVMLEFKKKGFHHDKTKGFNASLYTSHQ